MATAFPIDKEPAALRMPPQAVEAERSVLGALMLSEDAWDKVADRVSENDFYRNDHKLIFLSLIHI